MEKINKELLATPFYQRDQKWRIKGEDPQGAIKISLL